jgi:hypothetical protein
MQFFTVEARKTEQGNFIIIDGHIRKCPQAVEHCGLKFKMFFDSETGNPYLTVVDPKTTFFRLIRIQEGQWTDKLPLEFNCPTLIDV